GQQEPGNPLAVAYTDDGKGSIVLDGADGTAISNVAAGVDADDAVNKQQMDAGDMQTLSAANSYTNNQIANLLAFDPASINGRLDALEDRFDAVDRRFHRQDRRIDRQGAMGSAMLNMAINAGGTQSPRGRIAIGAGFQGGTQALSIGYGKRIGNRGSFSLG